MAPVDAYPLSLQLVKDFALQVRLYSVFDPPNLVIWTILKDEKLTGKLNVYSVHPDMEDKYPHCSFPDNDILFRPSGVGKFNLRFVYGFRRERVV